ncbi:hypothetical protein DFQ28_001004, partial [Apophysomyces sp. BC1034]
MDRGEQRVQSRLQATLDPSNWQTLTDRFADGVGYATGIGYRTEEVLVIEASSGGIDENKAHTAADSLKLLEMLTGVLRLRSTRWKKASLQTFTGVRALGIQTVVNTMTLISVSLNNQQKYVYEELRHANIPATFDRRYDWVQIFELLACLFDILQDQKQLEKKLESEH